MRRHGPLHVLKVVVIVAVVATLVVLGTTHLWNWLMPAVFGLRMITWEQALGLLVLGRLLFGGLGRGRHGGGGGGRWKREMRERWGEMSPEERERLRAGLKGRWGCWPGHHDGPGREGGSEGAPVA